MPISDYAREIQRRVAIAYQEALQAIGVKPTYQAQVRIRQLRKAGAVRVVTAGIRQPELFPGELSLIRVGRELALLPTEYLVKPRVPKPARIRREVQKQMAREARIPGTVAFIQRQKQWETAAIHRRRIERERARKVTVPRGFL